MEWKQMGCDRMRWDGRKLHGDWGREGGFKHENPGINQVHIEWFIVIENCDFMESFRNLNIMSSL